MGINNGKSFSAFLVVIANAEKDFPLLMPMVKPAAEESYICTPIRLSDTQTFYVNRFTPNASAHTAHHMLIYGCDEPGSTDMAWNCISHASLEIKSFMLGPWMPRN